MAGQSPMAEAYVFILHEIQERESWRKMLFSVVCAQF
jgi:hypothetical protein